MSTGDARKKGGSYSTNPATMRTRAYNASLSPQKSAARKARFSEYRALRAVCIRASETDEYKEEKSRDEKIAMLREACHEIMAKRAAENKPIIGIDIELTVKRFHDERWARRCNNAAKNSQDAAASSVSGQDENDMDDGGQGGPSGQQTRTTNADIMEIEAALAEQEHAIQDMADHNPIVVYQLNNLTAQMIHLTETVAADRARIDALEARAQVESESIDFILATLAEFDK